MSWKLKDSFSSSDVSVAAVESEIFKLEGLDFFKSVFESLLPAMLMLSFVSIRASWSS